MTQNKAKKYSYKINLREMNMDNGTASGWFTLRAGFQVEGRCPVCHSKNISFYKIRTTGLSGISASSKGLTPVCVDCGKDLPTQYSQDVKNLQKKTRTIKAGVI
jgi:DNA-directed RNA polymerase subunit RPC12/RpoP